MRMVPILAHTGINHQYQMSVFAHFLKEWLISKCQFCRKWTSNLLWKKNEENSDGNTVFPIKLQIFSFGFGSAEFRWSYFGFGFGSAETKKVISVAHYKRVSWLVHKRDWYPQLVCVWCPKMVTYFLFFNSSLMGCGNPGFSFQFGVRHSCTPIKQSHWTSWRECIWTWPKSVFG